MKHDFSYLNAVILERSQTQCEQQLQAVGKGKSEGILF